METRVHNDSSLSGSQHCLEERHSLVVWGSLASPSTGGNGNVHGGMVGGFKPGDAYKMSGVTCF